MLSAPAVDLNFDSDDDWVAEAHAPRLYRAASVGNSWGVTSMGRGFDWKRPSDDTEAQSSEDSGLHPPKIERSKSERDVDAQAAAKRRNRLSQNSLKPTRPTTTITLPPPPPPINSILATALSSEPESLTSSQSRPASPRPLTPISIHSPSIAHRNPLTRSNTPTMPRPRRRSSQQRVSLVAGRVLIAPIDAPPSPVMTAQNMLRTGSSGSLNGKAPPLHHNQSFLGERKISEFTIEKEIGRGAYGLVKLARENQKDGALGVRCVNMA